MNKDQVQLFECEYGTRCDTFGCGEAAVSFVGRPDAPYSTNYILCKKCSDELIESITEQFELHAKSVHAPVSVLGVDVEGTDITVVGGKIVDAINQAESENAEYVSLEASDDATLEEYQEEEGFDIDAMLEDARTHADLDKIIELIGLTNVPPKEDAEGKHTMDERKAAILANFEDAE